jgi:hypothetical protein
LAAREHVLQRGLDEDRYAAWLHRCETEEVTLWNRAAAVRANIDKRYLADFASAGVAIVRTIRTL